MSASTLMEEKKIHKIFVISLILKAANAALQLGFGALFLLTGKATDFVMALAQNELIEDPHDFIASHIAGWLSHLTSSSEYFAGLYLISHGIIKIVLVWALIKNKLWAYPASLAVLAVFIAYQVVRFAETHSIFLVLLTVFDAFVYYLIVHEYRYLLAKRKASQA